MKYRIVKIQQGSKIHYEVQYLILWIFWISETEIDYSCDGFDEFEIPLKFNTPEDADNFINEKEIKISDISESPQDNSHGDLVPLIWLIEELRKREGGCTMKELVEEAKKNFKGLEHIKHRTINYR